MTTRANFTPAKFHPATQPFWAVGTLVAVVLVFASGCGRTETAAPAVAVPAVFDGKHPTLVEFGTGGGCLPCKLMEPVLDELRKEQAEKFSVSVVDVRKDREAIKRYDLRVLPTQILFDRAGRELSRHEGFYAKGDILEKWRTHGVAVSP